MIKNINIDIALLCNFMGNIAPNSNMWYDNPWLRYIKIMEISIRTKIKNDYKLDYYQK